MHILLSVDIFTKFFSERNKIEKNEFDLIIDSIIYNNENKFLLSKAFLTQIEDAVNKHNKEDNFFAPFMAYFINAKSIPIKLEEQDITQLMKKMCETYLGLPTKRDAFFTVTESEEDSLHKQNSVCFSNYHKPNYDWIALNLMAYHPKPVVLRYFDFADDNVVKETFNAFYRLSIHATDVDIYDKQTNIEHDLYDEIKSTQKIHYFTSLNKYSSDYGQTCQKLKSNFLKIKLYSSKPNKIHERRIVINNVFLESDEDFWNLTPSRPTWKLEIFYCKKSAAEFKKKKDEFTHIP